MPKYYDVLERTLYNGVLSGISLDGGAFFYPNPLESIGQHTNVRPGSDVPVARRMPAVLFLLFRDIFML